MMVRCDLFCRVVDNLGDAGVAWRLARRLAAGHGLAVRLWIDQPAALAGFVDAAPDDCRLRDSGQIAVRTWTADSDFGAPAELVIETFGCDVPERYVAALAARSQLVRWYNLEYLSAEDWVDGCHALPSPHPRWPLTRIFFFPGFSAATGGLLREPGLLARRQALGASPPLPPACGRAERLTAKPEPAARAGSETGATPALQFSVFCYPDAPLAAWLDALAAGDAPVHCRIFQGAAQTIARAWHARHPGHPLQLELLPWLSQDDFDQVLWAADLNIVRGEDSFVRAQWAGRPLVWDIYPQQDEAHLVKMAAFLRRYRADLAPPAAAALGGFWQAWVRREADGIAEAWADLAVQLTPLRRHAEGWCTRLAARPDLADALLAHAGLG